MRTTLIIGLRIWVTVCFLPDSVTAQSDTVTIGDWEGKSICQLKNSACHDELVIYHILNTTNPLVYQVTGFKITGRDTLNMGTLDFRYDKTNRTLICSNKNGTWRLVITGSRIDGELRTPDNNLFRIISLNKKTE